MTSIEWNKLDDTLLFLVWAFMAWLFLAYGQDDVASNLISGWMGAVAMYLRNSGT